MFIFLVHHFIKPEQVTAYQASLLANARQTVQEPGVIRFEVMQDAADPTHFCLLEVYRDEAAREAHLQAPHFLAFKEAVIGGEMFARRGQGYEMAARFPAATAWRRAGQEKTTE